VPNIGPRERKRRLGLGLVSLACAIGTTAAFWSSGVPRIWRALLFPLILLAAVAFLQVKGETCVALAARGLRNLDAGNERIVDPDERAAVKAQARRVLTRALIVAAVITVGAIFV
jgi:hypothetical protein